MWMHVHILSAPPMLSYPVCDVRPAKGYTKERPIIVLVCESRSALPPDMLKWYNGTSGKLLDEGRRRSSLVTTVVPSKHDNGKPFYCSSAENEATQMLDLERMPNCSLLLDVVCE